MFTKGKLFAGLLISALVGAVGVYAQTVPTPPNAPKAPTAPRAFEFYTSGSGGYLGVQSQDVTKENFSKFGLREVRGVAIEKVVENSPAAQAGLQNGDVILRFNSEEVTSVRKLTRLISEVAPDHQVRITVFRNGGERELTATLGKRPGVSFSEGAFGGTLAPSMRVPLGEMPRIAPFPNGTTVVPSVRGGDNVFMFGNNRQIGVGVSSLSKQLGDYFGVADGKGVLINNVIENSPAAKAGLRTGDVIIEIDGKAVNETFDLSRAVNEKKEGDVTLTIIRNKNRQTVRVTPEKGKNSGLFEFYTDQNSKLEKPLQEYFKVLPGRAQPSVRVLTAPRILE